MIKITSRDEPKRIKFYCLHCHITVEASGMEGHGSLYAGEMMYYHVKCPECGRTLKTGCWEECHE